MNAFDTSYQGGEGFITKFSSFGKILWSTYFGGNDYDYISGLVFDNSSNIYVVGSTQSTDFPTPYTKTQLLISNAFVAKLSSNGNYLWGDRIESPNTTLCSSIAVYNNDVYVFGQTNDNVSSEFLFNDNSTLTGPSKSFIIKYNSSGSKLFTKVISTSSMEFATGLAVDSQGNIYISGTTWNTGKSIFNISFLDYNNVSNSTKFRYFYVYKFSPDFKPLWGTHISPSDNYDYSQLVMDQNGDVIVQGMCEYGTMPLVNANYVFTTNNSTAQFDIYLAKFSGPSGSILWSTYLGGSNSESASNIVISAHNDLLISGLTFSSDFPTTDTSFNSQRSAFLTKFTINEPIVNKSNGSVNNTGESVDTTQTTSLTTMTSINDSNSSQNFTNQSITSTPGFEFSIIIVFPLFILLTKYKSKKDI